MTRSVRTALAIVMLVLAAAAGRAQTTPPPSERAGPLAPLGVLAGPTWIAQGEGFSTTLTYRWLLPERVLEAANEVRAGDGRVLARYRGMYAWDAGRKEIVFWTAAESGEVHRGRAWWADGILWHEADVSGGRISAYASAVRPQEGRLEYFATYGSKRANTELLETTPLVYSAADQAAAVATTPYFRLYSDLDTNLHDALIVAGDTRMAREQELFASGDERGCFEALAPSARAGWHLAVDWYRQVVSPAEWTDRQQNLIRADLAALKTGPRDERAASYLEIARAVRAAARPAYEACRWPAQNARNRQWIEALASRLAPHEEEVARRLADHFEKPWHGLPIRVDVVATAPPLGANSIILSPAGGHLLISSSSLDGDRAFETLFHEASHTLNAPWRPDPVPKALADAAARLGVPLQRDLWHVVLFYTVGETVRRVLAEAGQPGYTPYLYAFDRFGTGDWGRARDALERVWPAYMKGEIDLESAAVKLLQEIGRARR